MLRGHLLYREDLNAWTRASTLVVGNRIWTIDLLLQHSPESTHDVVIKSQEALPLLSVDASPQSPTKLAVQRELLVIPAQIQGVVLVASSCVLFSLQSVLVKYASYSMPSNETVFWRSIVGWAFTLMTIRVRGLSLRVEREYWGPLSSHCVFGTCGLFLSYYAMQHMVLADAATLLDTNSVMTFLLGALAVKERVDPITGFVITFKLATWLAILGMGVLAFGGQLLLTRGFQLEKAGVAAAMVNVNVALVFLWDVTLLHEKINTWSVVGAATIITGAVLLVRRLHSS